MRLQIGEMEIQDKALYTQLLYNVKENTKRGLRRLFKSRLVPEDLENLKQLKLEHLVFQDLNFLRAFKQLEEVDFLECEILDLRGISYLTHLKYFSMLNSVVKDLTPIENCYTLEMFDYILYEDKVQYAKTNFDFLTRLPNLWEIDITGNKVSDFSFIEKIPGLKELIIVGNPIQDLKVMLKLPRLKDLEIGRCELKDLEILREIPTLTDLTVEGSRFTKEQEASYKTLFGKNVELHFY